MWKGQTWSRWNNPSLADASKALEELTDKPDDNKNVETLQRWIHRKASQRTQTRT